jgi:hypothetical protein
MYCLRHLFILCVINSLLFLNGDSSDCAIDDEALPQMGIHALEWNGNEWLIGGNTMRVFQDGVTPHPLLVKYSKSFTDISSQLDIEDTIIDRISWNGEYFLICYSLHEYGGLIKYDGYQIYLVPLPGEPLSLRVTTLDWNGEYWLIGSSYVGYGYLVKYDGVTITDVRSFFSGIKSITWMKDSWLISGINPDRMEILAKYDGNTFTEMEKPDFVGTITNSQWNGEYVLLESDGNLIQFDGVKFVDTGVNQVSSLAWNGESWLLGGGKGMLTMYDGSLFTDLTLESGISGRIQALGWNGEYWLLGDSSGVLKMYDGEEFTDLTSQLKDAVHFSFEPEEVVPSEQENASNDIMIGIVIILFAIFLSYFLIKKKYQ